MPFSPQPRKKGSQQPQEGSKPSCGHTISQKSCPECAKAAKAQTAKAQRPSNVVDLPTEKKRLATLQDKLADRFKSDPRAAEKAAFVLAQWIGKIKK